MKKEYKKPFIGLLPTKCHISTLSPEKPEEMDRSRRSLLIRSGLIMTVGHINLYGGTECQQGGCGGGGGFGGG